MMTTVTSFDFSNSTVMMMMIYRMTHWMEKKLNKFISPQALTELIQTMAIQALRDLVSAIQCTPLFTIMVDETTDISNKEQVVITPKWDAEDLQVHEDFIGLYVVDDIKATTLAEVMKDTLSRLDLSINKVHGQCYMMLPQQWWVAYLDWQS